MKFFTFNGWCRIREWVHQKSNNYKQENGGQIKLIIRDVSKIFTLISGNAIKMFDGDIESAREIYQ